MSYAKFRIMHAPSGKFVLLNGEAELGQFDDLDKAKDGLKRAVARKTFYFDAQGNEVEAS
jgi:hypothetical protein